MLKAHEDHWNERWFSNGLVSVRLMVGLYDLKGVFETKWFYDSLSDLSALLLFDCWAESSWACFPTEMSLSCPEEHQNLERGKMLPPVVGFCKACHHVRCCETSYHDSEMQNKSPHRVCSLPVEAWFVSQ